MKILVPIDGSEYSIKALKYAISLIRGIGYASEIAKNGTNEIILVNVLPHFHMPLGFEKTMKSLKTDKPISVTEYISEMNEMIKQEWIDRLGDLKKQYEDDKIHLRTELLMGSHSSRTIAASITKFASEEKVDMIVIGNVGLGGISKIKSLGSVSRNVAEISSCPVLIVH
ncbi:MAG TPA: universal stress protein [Candidatus Nitrosocosmicus sp.]|jgi:nucleotide-binding universal stress UspA family protein|nr:universal stress protein [Candidatus Nitrosocosmicus sp.]